MWPLTNCCTVYNLFSSLCVSEVVGTGRNPNVPENRKGLQYGNVETSNLGGALKRTTWKRSDNNSESEINSFMIQVGQIGLGMLGNPDRCSCIVHFQTYAKLCDEPKSCDSAFSTETWAKRDNLWNTAISEKKTHKQSHSPTNDQIRYKSDVSVWWQFKQR